MTEPHRVVVIDAPGLAPEVRLSAALERLLGVGGSATGDASPAIVVPELGAFAEGSPVATDPRLVEVLVDLLHARGYSEVVVGIGPDGSTSWAANRDPYALVELLGYRFITSNGLGYDVVDLADDLVAAPFDRADSLRGVRLNATWVNAGLRVVFASSTTDDVCGYHLGLGTCLRVLPRQEMVRRSVAPGESVSELLRATPVHLTVIDAIVSSQGSAGRRAPKPVRTDTIVAANDIWAADTVGALKMGLDPAVSPLFARAPDRTGVHVDGSVGVYPGFVSPHPLMLDAMTRLDASPWVSRLLRPWLQVLDAERFPLETLIDASMNERLANRFADPDADPLAFAALVIAGYSVGAAQRALDSYRIMYAKDSIGRQDVALGFDPDAYPVDAYWAIVSELTGLEGLLDGAEERGPGLRWRYLDRAVLFDYTRTVPVDFDEFVTAVDVAKAISFMNDYLGGIVLELAHDDMARPIRQAERNLYLPQPNYLALSGGQPIDVGKLEIAEYAGDRHRLYWKTIESQNGSATYDDGILTFDRTAGGTKVTIFGRQLFTLPPLWNTMDLALAPELKAHLVTDAYQTFFDRTLANFEALTEGRDIRIGSTPAGRAERRPSAELEDLGERMLERIQALTEQLQRPAAAAAEHTLIEVDDLGFSHFQARSNGAGRDGGRVVSTTANFWVDLIDAGLRDLATARDAWTR